jgi:hypothetical protein
MFSCAVKLHIDDGPVWIHKDGDPPDHLYVPTDSHEYDLHARKSQSMLKTMKGTRSPLTARSITSCQGILRCLYATGGLGC